MIALELDDLQRAAVDVPFDRCVAILGASGTGTTTTLALRAQRARMLFPDAAPLLAFDSNDLINFAWSWLRDDGYAGTALDDVAAASLFAQAARPFFALEWLELRDGSIDPEVAGARSPERFLASAFDLISKLRDALIAPDEFLRSCLSGAAAFYAKPPNFAHPQLLSDTKELYRNSLNVTPEELQRQYRREVDLAKILAKLYAEYCRLADSRQLLTRRDALDAAARRLSVDPPKAEALRVRLGYACIDNAHELRANDIALLRSIFGDDMGSVTFAGDPQSATGTFRGARPEAVFSKAHETIVLTQQHRSPPALDSACRQLAGSFEKTSLGSNQSAMTLFRAKTPALEVAYVAQAVAAHLADGARPNDIALIFRSVADVQPFQNALLELDIPFEIAGDYSLFTDRYALDGLALLWNIWDPFQHEWLLRTLTSPPLALSDASLAILSSEPENAQTSLFISEDDDAPTLRSRRWDPKRDVRLGWNVLRGDCDGSLNEFARMRVQHFRQRRLSWIEQLETLPIEALLELVWSEGLSRAGAVGSARAIAQQRALEHLKERLVDFAKSAPEATLGDVLTRAKSQALGVFDDSASPPDERCVQILSVDAARGREFAHVILPDACAGAFPRWYVADSFLYSPTFGMIPKENAGDACTARTAKFTYYMHYSKTRDHYNAQERRAFIYALRRATRTALITASGRATRGITAPEFFEELRSAKLPGTRVIGE